MARAPECHLSVAKDDFSGGTFPAEPRDRRPHGQTAPSAFPGSYQRITYASGNACLEKVLHPTWAWQQGRHHQACPSGSDQAFPPP